MKFELQATDKFSNARAGLITTDHGPIETPHIHACRHRGVGKGRTSA